MKSLFVSTAVVIVVVTLSACGDDGVGVPQPVPIPREFLLRGSVGVDLEAIRMVGLPGAVGWAGDVILDGGGGEVIVRSTEAGTFVASVPYTGAAVHVRFETSEAVAYAVNTVLPVPEIIPKASMESTPISVPVDGKTTIIGVTDPSLDVFAVNLRSADVVLGASDVMGDFTLELAAESGDEVEVYVNSDPLAGAWELMVP